jgi:peptide/nickel transport system permease protein
MLAYLSRRLLATIPVMAIVAVLVFAMLRLTPGDPAAIIAGAAGTAQDVAAIRARLGLDRSIFAQFFVWIGNILTGDFGESFFFKKQVADLIADRIGPTLALATTTIVLSVVVAVPLGVLAAWKQGTWIDRIVMGFSVLGFSVPVFVIGYLLIYVFAIEFGWLPVQGYQPLREGFWGFLQRLILPSMTLSVIYIALIARITRTSVLEVLAEDYIRTARAKGLSPLRVVALHAFRNALIPVITVIGLQVGVLFTGAILTETIFSWPGVGKWLIEAINRRDYPVLQGGLLLLGVVVMVVNLLVDVAYGIINPRIRRTA